MWAPTDRANHAWRFACRSGVIPLAAALAEQNARMDTGRMNNTRVALNKERPPHTFLRPGTSL